MRPAFGPIGGLNPYPVSGCFELIVELTQKLLSFNNPPYACILLLP
jgi:hypothetical protein